MQACLLVIKNEKKEVFACRLDRYINSENRIRVDNPIVLILIYSVMWLLWLFKLACFTSLLLEQAENVKCIITSSMSSPKTWYVAALIYLSDDESLNCVLM